MLVVYYSSNSEYTHRFVGKLRHPAVRIPQSTNEDTLLVDEPFVLVTPTYGAGPHRGAVPKQVITFLNVKDNRDRLLGVIGAGNTNFGEDYCKAARIVAAKCRVPLLHRVELLGTDEDVTYVDQGLDSLWQQRLKPAI
ncbi:class Ib ribonucleoside-diphosphate reductase assembly flavoprotein NrdI [Brevibacterium litoralis]|uniref:class Ib ribonucleoside-diphosphate reductase assembly flavoprotein NrdI n=1 Tax=Brevibacterium litoralis TaxID=3138935 RepID=UPI0032F065DA